MSSSVFDRIRAKLDAVGVVYTADHHEAVTTSAEAAKVRGVDLHTGAKALVMQGDKTGKILLFILPADLRLDKKKVKALFEETFSFASDPVLVTGCVKGSVPPFGSVVGLVTYCDQRLVDNEYINFNAGSLTDSIRMKYEDYVRVEQPRIVDIAEASPSSSRAESDEAEGSRPETGS